MPKCVGSDENRKATSRTGVERTFIESLAREEEWALMALLWFTV